MSKLLFIFFVLFMVFSCTIQKRTFNKGYYISWNKRYQNSVKTSHIDLQVKNNIVAENTEELSRDTFQKSVQLRSSELDHCDTSLLKQVSVFDETKSRSTTQNLKDHKNKVDLIYRKVTTYKPPIWIRRNRIDLGLTTDTYAILAHIGFALFATGVIILITTWAYSLLLLMIMSLGFSVSVYSTFEGIKKVIDGDWGVYAFSGYTLIFYTAVWLILMIIMAVILV